MSPKNHLMLLRLLRVVFFALGAAVMTPLMDVQESTLSFADALPLLGGIVLMFAPYWIVARVIPARCARCGGSVYISTKWDSTDPSQDSTPQRIRAFRWICQSCGVAETKKHNIVDNLIPPYIH